MKDIRLRIGCHDIRILGDGSTSITEVGEGYSICIDMSNEEVEEFIRVHQGFKSNNSNEDKRDE